MNNEGLQLTMVDISDCQAVQHGPTCFPAKLLILTKLTVITPSQSSPALTSPHLPSPHPNIPSSCRTAVTPPPRPRYLNNVNLPPHFKMSHSATNNFSIPNSMGKSEGKGQRTWLGLNSSLVFPLVFYIKLSSVIDGNIPNQIPSYGAIQEITCDNLQSFQIFYDFIQQYTT